MISNRKNLLIVVIVRATVYALIALNQLMVTTTEAQVDQQSAAAVIAGLPASSNNIDSNGVNDLRIQQQQQSSMPGHYEFEVAPKMEPPSVRRPPYQQSSTQTCPGSDPFAGFSPKDTLCGNLNEGRVPLNPLGQNINDQSYPFELIKNKTLQFLARALPVLKLEYESIPKVARYLPGQQLLNPTHMSSPLGHDHFHRLNQRLAVSDFSTASSGSPYPMMQGQSRAGRRRRKRSLAHASYTVAAELSPNASLLVSSAHSGPGRIRDFMGHQAGPESSPPPLAVITKDGYRPIAYQYQPPVQSSSLAKLAQSSNSTQTAAAAPKLAPILEQNNNATRQIAAAASSSQNKVGGLENRQQHVAGSTPASQSITAAPTPTGNSQQRNHAKATTADSGQGAAQVMPAAAAASPAQTARSTVEHQQQAQPTKQEAGNGNSSTANTNKEQTSSSGLSKRRSLMGCSDSANGFSSAICQAAVALIEGGERQPVWLQVAKQLGNALAGVNDPVSAPSGAANNPIWSILSGLSAIYVGQNNEAQSKSAGGSNQQQQSSSRPNLMNLIGPITSLLAGSGSATNSRSSHSSKEAAPSSSSSPSASSSSSSSDESSHKAADLATAPSFTSALTNSLGSSTMAKLALAGWASNAVAGLLDYFAPSLFSSATRGFSRRKSKPYDPMEQFIDTPASLAALTAAPNAASQQQQARQLQPGLNGQQQLSPKQPPTPCPSVEEYISPTFARNYQGTWKYVIQIPHEGYFTQTIQRTSCVRQRCEFTDGVCHESPRWVSLLVAEIYYPHAVFSQPGGEQVTGGAASSILQQPPLSASPSMSSIQQVQPAQQQQRRQMASASSITSQDPLQMTDSLNTYNHNLNSAFIEAANGLGLDPNNAASMQQLADAYSYQLMQRQGLLPSQNQMESRSTNANSNPLIGAASSQQYSIQPPANQPLQSQQKQQQQQRQAVINSNVNNDYILSLAASALQQNPHLSINDLIASLQQSLSRKKRDSVASGAASPAGNQSSSDPTAGAAATTAADQTECDGHDKIGCYVVRVYYDWFLVNGSCKCWKTNTGQKQSGQQAGNSFLRRILTG